MRPSLLPVLLLIGAVAAAIALAVRDYGRRHPQDVPWTALDLGDPTGRFTGRKLAALTGEPGRCRMLLEKADVRFTPLPERRQGRCGYDDAVRLRGGGSLDLGWRPADLGASCPVAAALFLWNRDVVQPAARRHLGGAVARIDTFGSYNCRRMYGRGTGDWSEHATADAVDIAAFRLADGRRVAVKDGWTGDPSRAAFLRAVRDGACRLFSTVLSPDYNAAHADHLHLDQAERGATGWRACR
ncbi:MAG: extensin family protein [Sphingobium sp.]